MKLLTLDDISEMFKLSRVYVRDSLVKRADFPRPYIAVSQKSKRWDLAAVTAWAENSSTNISR